MDATRGALFAGSPAARRLAMSLVVLIGLTLLLAPFLFQDVRSQQVAARICIFIVLVASYDLLIGYTGIVSFAHTMFFGLGAYGTAIALRTMGVGFDAIAIGGAAGVLAAALLALLIGLLSLRVKAIFFAMVTLAAASVMLVLASQLSDYTGGEDGMTFSVPRVLSAATRLVVDEQGKAVQWFGVGITGRLLAYYGVFFCSLAMYLVMLRIVSSPLGTVLAAIRENELRAEAIGYRVVAYRTAVFCLAAVIAALAGVLWAVWLKYVGPDTSLSFAIMIDILLMVVIGGMGTIHGAVVGVTLMSLAQFYLKDLMGSVAGALEGVPLLPALFDPDRWLLWLGLLFIALVYAFPAGIIGTLMRRRAT